MSLLRKLGQMALATIFISGGSQAFLQPGHRVKTLEKAGLTMHGSHRVSKGLDGLPILVNHYLPASTSSRPPIKLRFFVN